MTTVTIVELCTLTYFCHCEFHDDERTYHGKDLDDKCTYYSKCVHQNGCAYHCEVHDLEDPYSQGQVDDHGDQQKQDEEVEAALPPAVYPHGIGLGTGRPLQVVGLGCQHVLLLGHLQDRTQGAELFNPQKGKEREWERETDRKRKINRKGQEEGDRSRIALFHLFVLRLVVLPFFLCFVFLLVGFPRLSLSSMRIS